MKEVRPPGARLCPVAARVNLGGPPGPGGGLRRPEALVFPERGGGALRAVPCDSRSLLLTPPLTGPTVVTSGLRAGFSPGHLRPCDTAVPLDRMGTRGVCLKGAGGPSLCRGTPVPSTPHGGLVADPSLLLGGPSWEGLAEGGRKAQGRGDHGAGDGCEALVGVPGAPRMEMSRRRRLSRSGSQG